MIKKILFLAALIAISSNSFSNENEVMMRMYERLEMVREQMQQLTEENQQLNNKIQNLQNQQDRLYQDLSKKIQKMQEAVDANNKKIKKENIITSDFNDEKENKKSVLNNNANKKIEKENIIPKDESDLDVAKIYKNDNFKKNLETYELKSEIELYRSAFQLVKDKNYKDAEDSFNAFLFLFPESNYAANAQYWLSESIYAQGDYKNAMINFATVIENYPKSSKIADAKLKIGYCYYSIKKWKEARFIFSGIKKDYPNTSLSQLAEKKIKSMDVEGR